MGRTCGNPECGSSTGIHGGITFGSGHLDSLGYWEHPCRKCAADFDASIEDIKKRTLEDAKRIYRGDQAKIDAYMEGADWLRLKAWPYDPAGQAEDKGEPAGSGGGSE